MAQHLDLGILGEEMAVRFLARQGYVILSRNWRYKALEVDIIAEDAGILIFVEVKSRTGTGFGAPHEFVDKKKQKKLLRAAECYIAQNAYQGEIRFDIVSVYLKTKKIELIKDAFWSD